MGLLEEAFEENVLTTKVDWLLNWARLNSIWPMTFGLACCAIEMMAVGAAHHDIDRFGAGAFRATPRQADLMIVAGTVNFKMGDRIKRLYDQMPEPKWSIAMGVCSSSGGMYDSYSVVQGVDTILPVDVYVPGCPPRPDAVIDAILKLQTRVARERPVKDILEGIPDYHDTGTGHELRQPNRAVVHQKLPTLEEEQAR